VFTSFSEARSLAHRLGMTSSKAEAAYGQVMVMMNQKNYKAIMPYIEEAEALTLRLPDRAASKQKHLRFLKQHRNEVMGK